MSTPLLHMQRFLMEALLSPESVRAAERDAFLLPSERLSAASRLEIYQKSYFLRLLRCMEAQFPALRHALGPPLFADFMREYLRDCPSNCHSLYHLGDRLPAWLSQNRPDADAPEAWVDFMLELSAYELSLFRMFDAPGHEEAPWPTVATPDENLRLQPCFERRLHHFPVAAYYHSVRANTAPELPGPQMEWVAIVRRDYQTVTLPLTSAQYHFLGRMAEGKKVGEVLQEMAEASGWPEERLRRAWEGGTRQRWLEEGVFVGGSP